MLPFEKTEVGERGGKHIRLKKLYSQSDADTIVMINMYSHINLLFNHVQLTDISRYVTHWH